MTKICISVFFFAYLRRVKNGNDILITSARERMKIGLVLEGGDMRGLEKNPARLEQVYNLGLNDATRQWQALEEYLTK